MKSFSSLVTEHGLVEGVRLYLTNCASTAVKVNQAPSEVRCLYNVLATGIGPSDEPIYLLLVTDRSIEFFMSDEDVPDEWNAHYAECSTLEHAEDVVDRFVNSCCNTYNPPRVEEKPMGFDTETIFDFLFSNLLDRLRANHVQYNEHLFHSLLVPMTNDIGQKVDRIKAIRASTGLPSHVLAAIETARANGCTVTMPEDTHTCGLKQAKILTELFAALGQVRTPTVALNALRNALD